MPLTDAYTLHKPTRNLIREYDRNSLAELVLDIFLQNEDDFEKGYLPWECLLLLRWVLQYAEEGRHLKVPTKDVVVKLVNSIKTIYNQIPTLDVAAAHGVPKFMRRIAFQQLTYQIPFPQMGWQVGRQITLFDEIGRKYGVSERFRSQTGLPISTFLNIAFAIFATFEQRPTPFINLDYFKSVFSTEDLENFFALTSLSLEQSRQFLIDDAQKKGKHFYLQLYEPSPFCKKPFLKANSRYILVSKRLYRQFYSNFIYDFLCGLPDKFRDFGDILETYIHRELEKLDIPLIRGKSWHKILGKQIKAPDFTIVTNECTVFLESKRKHIPDILRVTQNTDSMSKHLDDSIVAGIVQIYSLAHELSLQKHVSIKSHNFFAIVVSYKEHYLRGGEQFWEEFLGEAVTKELSQAGIDPKIIPPQNIFLVSIEEFDFLVAFLLHFPEMNLHSVLSQVRDLNANPKTEKFFFFDYLALIAADGIAPRPEHLWDKVQGIINKLLHDLENGRAL